MSALILVILQELPAGTYPPVLALLTAGAARLVAKEQGEVDELVPEQCDPWEQQEFDDMFWTLVESHPDLRGTAYGSRRIGRNRRWADGGRGEAEDLAVCLLRPLVLLLLAAGKVRGIAARRRERRSR